jgi:hypothetical protein
MMLHFSDIIGILDALEYAYWIQTSLMPAA